MKKGRLCGFFGRVGAEGNTLESFGFEDFDDCIRNL
jgi:hypothetical protein